MIAGVTLRRAEPRDVPVLLDLIRALATYEREPDAVKASEADLLKYGFGEMKTFSAILAEQDGKALGFALWFPTYSTWVGKPSLYLEDLFVLPDARGKGIGRELLRELARIALAEGMGRLDWKVLDWNTSATAFYESLGAKPMRDWFSMRIEGEAALTKLAGD
jgi:GNAT superfamily N-acetyltransferase